ncbi:hypothetical protein QEN19_002910 [Hanseniaspora menglaensis]
MQIKAAASSRSSTLDSGTTLRSMSANIAIKNQQSYHSNLVRNEKLQFNLVLEEYKETLNFSIEKQNCTTNIINFTSILKQQPEINNSYNDPKLRVKHLNMLIVLQNLKQLTQQTIHHTLYLFDLYCSKRVLYKRHYTLLFLTCFLVSCKYNDKKNKMPTIDELVKLANTKESLSPTGGYNDFLSNESSNSELSSVFEFEEIDSQMFHQMERHLLQTINWSLSFWSIEESLQCICIALKQRLQTKINQQEYDVEDNYLGHGVNSFDSIKTNSADNIKESDLLLLYQTASFLGEVSHTIPEFNTLASDVIGYVAILLAGKILEVKSISGVLSLIVDDENEENQEDILDEQNVTNYSPMFATNSFNHLIDKDLANKVLLNKSFPIKKLFSSHEENIFKCLHLFLNLLFDIDPLENTKNRRYNIFLQKYSQIGILSLVQSFQAINNKAYYKLIYLTNLEEETQEKHHDFADNRLVRDQIIHVSKYFLGFN